MDSGGAVPTLNAFDVGDTRATVLIPIAFDTQFGSNANTFEDQAPTLKASQQPPSVTGSTVRRLTPTECERLQGFPDGWTAERFDEKKQTVIAQADSNRYKQMGNAVAVPVVEWIVQRLVAQSKTELTSPDDNATPQPKKESRE